jgi:hypothetical protein
MKKKQKIFCNNFSANFIKFCAVISILYTLNSNLYAQEADSLSIPTKAKKIDFNGYISGLYIPMYTFETNDFQNIGWLHNRLNFKWMPAKCWDISTELRTRVMFQDFRGYRKEQFKAITQDQGWLNLGWNVATSKYLLLTTSVERLYAAYQTDKCSVKIGRQRINWSQSLVYNPNDIFNGYSFFDFDYPERQGSDAIRLSAYPSGTSAVELAAKLNYFGEATIAGLYRFNVKGWDLQMLGGLVNKYDLMLGTGFSGDIKGVNLRGEFSYYYSTLINPELKNSYVASLGVDYIFKNSIMLAIEGLYNRLPKNYAANLNTLYSVPMSPKYLSITEWTVCAQISYPFTPILTGRFAAMSFINLPAFYLAPSIDYSALNNLTLSVMVQFFTGGLKAENTNMLLGYLRLKYNF